MTNPLPKGLARFFIDAHCYYFPNNRILPQNVSYIDTGETYIFLVRCENGHDQTVMGMTQELRVDDPDFADEVVEIWDRLNRPRCPRCQDSGGMTRIRTKSFNDQGVLAETTCQNCGLECLMAIHWLQQEPNIIVSRLTTDEVLDAHELLKGMGLKDLQNVLGQHT